MLPVIEGQIRRRILLNFCADPAVVKRQLPAPLELIQQNGYAIVGICLIQFAHLRPKGAPAVTGLSSENVAHRVAIRFKENGAWRDGVFIWRRDTDCRLITLLGGRLFPGVHDHAQFNVREEEKQISIGVESRNNEADVQFDAAVVRDFQPTRGFRSFDEACAFFKRGDCGYSCSTTVMLEGMQLRTLTWEMEPLKVRNVHSSFYENAAKFPRGCMEFDCGLIMRNIPHEWHELGKL